MIDATTSIDATGAAAIAAALLGAGGIGGVLSFRKAGKEAENIAAKTLIEVNEELRRELARRDEEIERLRSKLTKLRRDFDALEAEFRQLAGQRPPHP
jgi:predicted nuclease with TOPRIM domain